MDVLSMIEKLKPVFNDVRLVAWCDEHLSKQPNIYIGIDEANPPAQEDYPLIAISSIAPRSEGGGRAAFDIEICCGVVDGNIDVAGRIRTYSGYVKVEAMRGELMGALRRAALGKIAVVDAGAIGVHPLYISAMTAQMEIICTGRR